MKFERRFGKRKQRNSKRGLMLVILLAIALYLFLNAESLLGKLL